MSNEVKKYDEHSTLPPEIATEIVRIFEQNYPTSHTAKTRQSDIEARNSEDALNALLAEGRVIFTVQDIRDKVLGLLEMREVDQGEGVYMQLVWIIVDTFARGQGIASQLHNAFQAEALERAKRISKPSCLLLSVHQENTDAIKVYERWGYTKGEVTENSKVFMFKDL